MLEIKKIDFNENEVIQPEWEAKLHEQFPESQKLNQEQYYDFLYNIALPYDEFWYLEGVMNYTPEQLEKVRAARDLIKHFIVSIERFPHYCGEGNGF